MDCERARRLVVCRYELDEAILEVVTSNAQFMAIIVADFTDAVHSTPWIEDEISGDATGQASAVVKLVCYTQSQLAALMNTTKYGERASLRDNIEGAKGAELRALRAVEPLQATVAEAGKRLLDAYELIRPRTTEPKLVYDQTVNAHYLPLGFAIRGQGRRADKRCRPVQLHGEARTFAYLRNSTYNASTSTVHDVTSDMLSGAGVVLAAAAQTLAVTCPEVLIAGQCAVGAPSWGDRFCAVPVRLQGGSAVRAIHCAQLGVRVCDASHGQPRGFRPTARHVDSGDVSLLPKRAAGDLQAHGLIVYLCV